MGSAKTLQKVLSGTSDSSIRFDELCTLLEALGFKRRVRGSHYLFHKEGVEGLINLQRVGNQAKRYQVRQVRGVIVENQLRLESEGSNDE